MAWLGELMNHPREYGDIRERSWNLWHLAGIYSRIPGIAQYSGTFEQWFWIELILQN
jgi:hypothetical protein